MKTPKHVKERIFELNFVGKRMRRMPRKFESNPPYCVKQKNTHDRPNKPKII